MKAFRSSYSCRGILQTLVDKGKTSILWDQRMMDTVVRLLTGLADASLRAFRHTATFCAMKLATALVELLVELVKQSVENQKELEIEKSRLEQQQVCEGRSFW